MLRGSWFRSHLYFQYLCMMGILVFGVQHFLCVFVGCAQGPRGPVFTQNSQFKPSCSCTPSGTRVIRVDIHSGIVGFTESFGSRLAWGGRVLEPLSCRGSTCTHVESCMQIYIACNLQTVPHARASVGTYVHVPTNTVTPVHCTHRPGEFGRG